LDRTKISESLGAVLPTDYRHILALEAALYNLNPPPLSFVTGDSNCRIQATIENRKQRKEKKEDEQEKRREREIKAVKLSSWHN
jgi:hypothetical protein